MKTSNAYKYEDFVVDVFKEHHDCMGLGTQEITDLVQDTTFPRIEKWLTKRGYDLKGDFANEN